MLPAEDNNSNQSTASSLSMQKNMIEVAQALSKLTNTLVKANKKSNLANKSKPKAEKGERQKDSASMKNTFENEFKKISSNLQASFKDKLGSASAVSAGIDKSGSIGNYLKDVGKDMAAELSSNIGDGVGNLVTVGLTSYLGPLAPIVGGVVGNAVGKFVGKTLGGLFAKVDPFAKIKAFRSSISATTSNLNKFKAELNKKTQTTDDKVKKWTARNKTIKTLQARSKALPAWYAKARAEARGETRVIGQSQRKKHKKERIKDRQREVKKEYIRRQESYLGRIDKLLRKNLGLSKQLLQYNHDLKGKLSSLSKTRDEVAAKHNDPNYGIVDIQTQLASTQDLIRQTNMDGLKDEEKAIVRESLLKLRQEEWKLQQKIISEKKKEIKEIERNVKAYQKLKDSISSHQTERARKDWGATEYSALYNSNQSQLAALDPTSKEAVQLAQGQFKLLKKIEGLQDAQLAELKSANESSKKLLEDLNNSDLNPNQTYESSKAKYESLKEKASTGDSKSIQEYNSYVNTYLKESQGKYKNSKQYQNLFASVKDDVENMIQSTESQMNQISTGQAGSLNVDAEYSNMQDRLSGTVGMLDQTVLDLNTALTDFINSLNTQAVISGSVPEYANGGIASGPTSGHLAKLHGTEAVIPLKGGFIPLLIQGGKHRDVTNKDSTRMSSNDPKFIEKMDQQNHLIGELIDVTRAKGDKAPVVIVDTAGLAADAASQVAEGSRRGVQNISVGNS